MARTLGDVEGERGGGSHHGVVVLGGLELHLLERLQGVLGRGRAVYLRAGAGLGTSAFTVVRVMGHPYMMSSSEGGRGKMTKEGCVNFTV